MRPIKFRAWDSESETMIYSDKNNDDYWWEIEPILKVGFVSGTTGGNQFEPPEPVVEYIENIMQFTGLLDKDGKEIYEGDVVQWDDDSKGLYWRICQVIWNKSRFELHGYSFKSKTPNDRRSVNFTFGQFIYEKDGILEIIGNVYENPELL